MVRPGVEVVSRAAPPTGGPPSSTGTWFVSGLTDRGPVNEAVLVRNMTEFVRVFGPRVTYGMLFDALDTFFREGGTRAFVARVVGPNAALDTVALAGADATDAITVSSIGPGASGLSVAIVAGDTAGTYRIEVHDADGLLERSPELASNTDAVLWGDASQYIRVTADGEANPAPVAAQPLAGGDDDRAAITDDERTAALNFFTKVLGPGQVSLPGATTDAAHAALLQHAHDTNRVAILDTPDTSTVASLLASVAAIRDTADPATLERGGIFAPWAEVPGVIRGTTRTVPYSAVQAGLIARRDGVTGNPNDPAAGVNGRSRYALSLSQPTFTDAQRMQLNEAGINIAREMHDGVRTYGYRTVIDPNGDPSWLSLAAARVRMAIEHDANALGEEFMFAQIDGRGLKIAEFNGALTGMLQGYWTLGALYGESPDEAFIVDTGLGVNTPESLARNELRAAIGLRTSPFAELVYIEIVKVPITEAL